MLLRFNVENYRAFRERQELSLVASALHDPKAGLIPWPSDPDLHSVPAAVVYGANASGKSTLVNAIGFLRRMVLRSHQDEVDAKIRRSPHRLDRAAVERPTTVEADFFWNEVRYRYGFATTDLNIEREWLFAYPRGRQQTLFTRNQQNFTFSRALKGRNQVISELTRPNSLFISTAAQNDHQFLTGVSRFFRRWGADLHRDSDDVVPTRTMGADPEIAKKIVEFLKSVGTGVVDYRMRDEEIPSSQQEFFQDVLRIAAQHSKTTPADASDESKKRQVLELAHSGVDGAVVYFHLRNESAGTRRMLSLLRGAYLALARGSLFVIDEIDSSLHTQACQQVLNLFLDRHTNPNGAQLIATAHDTNLLSTELLRRDQIWFTEKDEEGSAHVYPLTDIRTRSDDNLERGYLQGRFGAVPTTGRSRVRVT
jgi:predicted ATPase